MEGTEIPVFNRISRFNSGHVVGCRHELRGYQRDTQHDAQHLIHVHFFTYGPGNAHREECKDSLACQPEKIIGARPEWIDFRDRLGSVFQQFDVSDYVSEAQDQTADDDRGNNRREDLGQVCHRPLEQIHISFRGFLRFLLVYAVHIADCRKFIEELGDLVPNDDLELSALCKASFYTGKFFDSLHVRFLVVS